MTVLGMIVRADQGGLGNQTWEFWRHLKPEVVIVMCMNGHSRGREQPHRYEQGGWDSIVFYNHDTHLVDTTLMAVLSEVDVLFTVEGWYNDSTIPAARAAGVRTVVVANPELYDHHLPQPDCVVLPTSWAADRVPHGAVLPQPVALDRFADRRRRRLECNTVFHPSAPAMLDRNGTESFLNALPHVQNPMNVRVRCANRHGPTRVGKHWVDWMPHHQGDYWGAYPDEIDLLVLPRRYGGLCLPALEAAALGIPAVVLDTPPHNEWDFALAVPAREAMRYPMKGGEFPVYDPSDPRRLAKAIDRLVDDDRLFSDLSASALAYADSMSWARWLPEWERVARG